MINNCPEIVMLLWPEIIKLSKNEASYCEIRMKCVGKSRIFVAR